MSNPLSQALRRLSRDCSSWVCLAIQKGVAFHVLPAHWHREYAEHRLRKAISRGDAHEVEQLMDQGLWAPNDLLIDRAPIDEGVRFQRDRTALHLASSQGQFEIVQLFLSKGARANCKSNWMITPMHLAARNGHAHIVAELAAHGGDPLDSCPCLSNYVEDDPYCPTSIEILKTQGVVYTGDENRRYCAARDQVLLHQTCEAVITPQVVRPRL